MKTNSQEVQIAQTEQNVQLKQAEYALTTVGQDEKQFALVQRRGQMLAASTIVPDTFKGNTANCVIALELSTRMGASPLMVMQNLYIVHGNPTFSSKFLIAAINASGRFSPLRYEFDGKEGTEAYRCRCFAYEAADKEHKDPLLGDWISMSMAKKEGWLTKSGSKWQSMPNQMLRYRAAAFWQRVYCPEITMGLMSSEELQDTYIDDQTPITKAPTITPTITIEDNNTEQSEETRKAATAQERLKMAIKESDEIRSRAAAEKIFEETNDNDNSNNNVFPFDLDGGASFENESK